MFILSVQVEEKLPMLKRFRNSWAAEYIVKDVFNGHKSYLSRKKRLVSRASRRAGRASRRATEQVDDEAKDRHMIMNDVEADNDAAQHEQMHMFGFEDTGETMPMGWMEE